MDGHKKETLTRIENVMFAKLNAWLTKFYYREACGQEAIYDICEVLQLTKKKIQPKTL